MKLTWSKSTFQMISLSHQKEKFHQVQANQRKNTALQRLIQAADKKNLINKLQSKRQELKFTLDHPHQRKKKNKVLNLLTMPEMEPRKISKSVNQVPKKLENLLLEKEKELPRVMLLNQKLNI